MGNANPRGRSGFLDIRTIEEAKAVARHFRGQWVVAKSVESGVLLGRFIGLSLPQAWSVRACFGYAHFVVKGSAIGEKHIAPSNIRSIQPLHRTI